jgi:hypothetical protein
VQTLFAIHEKGWCVLDLRWPNIVRVRETAAGKGFRFYIIDCEFATRIGEPVPKEIQHHFAGSTALASSAVSVAHDWYMLASMARKASQRIIDAPTLQRGLSTFAGLLSNAAATQDIAAVKRHPLFSAVAWNEL